MRFKFFLTLVLFIIVNCLAFLSAEEETKKTYFPQMQKEECLKNFNIDSVNFKDPKVIRTIPLLAEYFQCRAVVRDDINECNNLNPWLDRVETCRKYFNEYHGFFGRLLKEGLLTPQILNFCMAKIGLNLNREECISSSQAFLTNDLAFCERQTRPESKRKERECKAMISGDRTLCDSDTCINKASYIKAIKTGDIKECEKIKNPLVKTMCQGYISGDEKICQKNKGFEEFKNRYCE